MKTFRSLVLVWAFAAMAVVPAFGNMINILAQVDCVGGQEFMAEWMFEEGQPQMPKMLMPFMYPAEPGEGWEEAIGYKGHAISGFSHSGNTVSFNLSFKQGLMEYKELGGAATVRKTKGASIKNQAISVTLTGKETAFTHPANAGECTEGQNRTPIIRGTISRWAN